MVRDDRFEWNDGKAAKNFAKHKIRFELARAAFDDPRMYEVDDPDPDEERWNRTCRIEVGDVEFVLTITYTLRDSNDFGWTDSDDAEPDLGLDEPRIHIISARKASNYERQIYTDPTRP